MDYNQQKIYDILTHSPTSEEDIMKFARIYLAIQEGECKQLLLDLERDEHAVREHGYWKRIDNCSKK